MHIDRYVPAIKAFIFLTNTKENGSPYEQVPCSHIINNNYVNNYLKKSKEHLRSKVPIKPFNLDFYEESARKYGSKGQLIVAAVNGLHRRTPFEKVGQYRYTIRFVLYNSLSFRQIGYKLIKSFRKC